jgi:hypothetical protein
VLQVLTELPMHRRDFRYFKPNTTDEQPGVARAVARELRRAVRFETALFGGVALAGAAFVIVSELGAAAARSLLPAVLVFIVVPGAALALGGVWSLFGRPRPRRRRLTGRREARKTHSPFRRNPHGRPRLHPRHHRLLRNHPRVQPRFGTTLTTLRSAS